MSTDKPNPATPQLPPMTQEERKLWAASHRLPANMILMSIDEMMQINRAIRVVDGEVKAWRSRMAFLVGTEQLDEAAGRIMEMRTDKKDALEKLQALINRLENDNSDWMGPWEELESYHEYLEAKLKR